MSDLVENPDDRFSRNAAQIIKHNANCDSIHVLYNILVTDNADLLQRNQRLLKMKWIGVYIPPCPDAVKKI